MAPLPFAKVKHHMRSEYGWSTKEVKHIELNPLEFIWNAEGAVSLVQVVHTDADLGQARPAVTVTLFGMRWFLFTQRWFQW
jgi:hypothetical protein